jgi:hypothetical protein
MQRSILFTMLLMLPYQFTWAAVSVYCDHHGSSQANIHFGHHSHAHALLLGEADQTPAPAIDRGLITDHEHYGNTLAVDAELLLVPMQLSFSFVLMPTVTPPDTASAEPDRPSWTSAV